MSYIDLQETLNEWSYDPEQISVRKIIGVDGKMKIQMRVELGVLQMEAEGRPDGRRPGGTATMLDYFRRRLTRFEKRNGTSLGFGLTPSQCQDLRAEASMYYRRFVCCFVLEEYDAVHRDTAHNLELFDFCLEYAMEQDDRAALEGYRPYVAMMDARSRTHEALEAGETASALAHVNRGLMHVANCLRDLGGSEELIEKSEELRLLRDLKRQVLAAMPKDSMVVTRNALKTAVQEERFEEAARLRDALEQIKQGESQESS